mgnify:CR=1 FL=1
MQVLHFLSQLEHLHSSFDVNIDCVIETSIKVYTGCTVHDEINILNKFSFVLYTEPKSILQHVSLTELRNCNIGRILCEINSSNLFPYLFLSLSKQGDSKISFLNLSSSLEPLLPRMRRYILEIVGCENSSFSKSTLPRNPVVPVTRSVLP